MFFETKVPVHHGRYLYATDADLAILVLALAAEKRGENPRPLLRRLYVYDGDVDTSSIGGVEDEIEDLKRSYVAGASDG